MSESAYLIIHKDHQLRIHGVNSGAEMATLSLARFLAKAGKRVVVAAQLVEEEQSHLGVTYWDLGDDFDVTFILERAKTLGSYHLISGGRAQSILESRQEEACRSRILISHDRSGNDTGIKPEVLTRVADAVICVSNAQREVFVNAGAASEKVHVIHNGVDLEVFRAGDPAQRDYQRLVFAGALVPDKGIQILIPAFATLKSKYPGLTLDVFGTASLWGRQPMFDETEIARQVPGITFHGGVPQAQIAQAYREAGIAVVPSIWFDPFPLSSIEAQVTGCPVVTCDVGGLKEGIRDGETGVVISDINQEQLVKTLDELLSDPQRLQKMSTQALRSAREYFNWERVAGDVIKLVATVSEKKISIDTEKQKRERAAMISDDGRILSESKIGFMTPWNQECGLATYARFMVEQFEEDSFTVFSETDSTRIGGDEQFVQRCWSRNGEEYSDLLAAIDRENIKLLHINGHYSFFKFPQFSEFLAQLRGRGVQSVLTLHSAFTADAALRELVQGIDLILVHSPEVRLEVIANGAQADRVRVLPHGVVVQKAISAEERLLLRRKLQMPEQDKVILAAGFVQPHKGMDGVLATVAALKQRGITASGYIAGKPNPSDPYSKQYLEQLKQLSNNAGLTNCIKFLDRFLAGDELIEYLQAADLVLMNYQSQHYEASGACSLAIGAGALVAASIAPPFAAFGDAVWHITAGYPADLSAQLILTNEMLANELRENGARYCKENSWSATYQRLLIHYRSLGIVPGATAVEAPRVSPQKDVATPQIVVEVGEVVVAETKREVLPAEKLPNTAVQATAPRASEVSSSPSSISVLMQNRSNALTQPGGDTIVMQRTISELERIGVKVTLDLEGVRDPASYDLVHIFNFALPSVTEGFARKAVAAGTPFVVTTLCEDAPAYRNQAMCIASHLMTYVTEGQNLTRYEKTLPDMFSISPAERFKNDWVVEHAAALLTNGEEESRVLCRDYGQNIPVREVPLGYDFNEAVDPELFVRTYGVRDFVLCVGRLEFRKNQLMLLKALEDMEVPVVLAAGGFSYDQAYSDAVHNFQRRGRTIITGRLSSEMLSSAYAAARVHALPSWYELPGLVSLEAAHHGCSIVATMFGTSADYLREHAHYCDPADFVSVRRAVESALNDKKIEDIQNYVKQFSWKNMGERTLEIYNNVLNEVSAHTKEKHAVETKDQQIKGGERGTSNSIALDSGGYDLADGTVEFQEWLERGELAAKNKEYNIAHDLLFRAEQMNPHSVRTLRARGAVFLAENQIAAARCYFERAFEFDAEDPKTLSGLGMCFMNEKETRKAYECFVRALETAPDALIAILQLLECSYQLEKFDDLVRALRRYLELYPADDEMRFCLAGALYKQGITREAQELIKAILQSSPDHAGAMQLSELIAASKDAATGGTISIQPAKIDKMVEASSSPVETNTFPEVSMEERMKTESQIAQVEELKRKKEFEKAVSGCTTLLEQFPLSSDQSERVRCLKAELTVLVGQMYEAVTQFDAILQAFPSSARALAGKGAIAATSNNWMEAEQLFHQALSVNANYDVALAGLGLCAATKNDLPAAWTYYMQSLESNPENMRALLGVLEIGYPMRRFEEIEGALQRYIELHPGDTELLYSLAGCYYVQGKVDEARHELDKLMLLAPDHEGGRELNGMMAGEANESSEFGF